MSWLSLQSRWKVAALTIGFLAVACAMRAAGGHVQRAVAASGSEAGSYDYLVSLPQGYESAQETRWPLLVFLHGAGHRGDDIRILTTLGPPKIIEQGAGLSPAERAAAETLTTKFIVVSPHCRAGERWEEARLTRLIDAVQNELRVDVTRVYLTGASMGGSGTWMLASRSPERFAALVPVCGGGRQAQVTSARGEQRNQLRTLGVWAFHNDRDPTVPLEASQQMVGAFREIDAADVKFTVYPGTRHDSWTRTYANIEVYEWLLAHRRTEGASRAALPSGR